MRIGELESQLKRLTKQATLARVFIKHAARDMKRGHIKNVEWFVACALRELDGVPVNATMEADLDAQVEAMRALIFYDPPRAVS